MSRTFQRGEKCGLKDLYDLGIRVVVDEENAGVQCLICIVSGARFGMFCGNEIGNTRISLGNDIDARIMLRACAAVLNRTYRGALWWELNLESVETALMLLRRVPYHFVRSLATEVVNDGLVHLEAKTGEVEYGSSHGE